MHTIPLARVSTLALAVLMACEPGPLPPDDTPERVEPPPPYDGPQLRVGLAEALPVGPFTQGRRAEPAGLTAPLERTRRIVMSPELAALDRELAEVLAGVEQRIHERGLTLQDLEAIAGDAEAERDMLGMTTAEYLAVHSRIADILTRAQRLMPNPPTGPLAPLQRDGSGGDDLICTTDTTVDELDDGTIVIHGHDSCWSWFPDDGGGDPPDEPPDGPRGGGGGNPPPMYSQFERECKDSGGEVKDGLCQCHQSNGCITAALASSSATIAACLTLTGCIPSLVTWGITYLYCRQEPCDKVNRHYGKAAP